MTVESDDGWPGRWDEDSESHISRPFDPEPELGRPLLDAAVEFEGGNGRSSPTTSRRGLLSTGMLGTSWDRSYGTSYGTISSRVTDSTRRHAIQLHHEYQTQPDVSEDCGNQQLLVKQVENDDGIRETTVVGQSTVPQTICNSVNVLIGVGLLSLPLAMKQAGWLLGLLFLIFAAVATSYTARILAKCLDVDPGLVTYADLAYVSFGYHARLVTSLLFCLELIGACVALVVLFGDSLHALVPAFSVLEWKIVCGVALLPLNFVPLRLLSVTSILGILSCTSSKCYLFTGCARSGLMVKVVLIIFIDGLLKPDAPGSLHQPARTYLFPDTWATVPLSLGLIMCK